MAKRTPLSLVKKFYLRHVHDLVDKTTTHLYVLKFGKQVLTEHFQNMLKGLSVSNNDFCFALLLWYDKLLQNLVWKI